MRYYHIDVELHQFGCEVREAVVSALGPPIVDDNVLALLVSELAKARSQRVNSVTELSVREHAEKADTMGLPGLLRPPCERPRCRRAAEQRDELASLMKKTIRHGTTPWAAIRAFPTETIA